MPGVWQLIFFLEEGKNSSNFMLVIILLYNIKCMILIKLSLETHVN